MAVLFVSHSNKDDAPLNALERWLRANGFSDLFVDHQHIVGGAKWREELRASAGACRVVVCLVTENWLSSDECFNEFRAAWYMGKRIIPLFLLSQPPALGEEAKQRFSEVAAEDQGVDLATCLRRDQTLDLDADQKVANRLKSGLRAAGALTRIGLDPEAFAIDRNLRPTPFPGLASFSDDDADAALFYGRSREIGEVLEELRRMRADRDLRPFVILGASGAGKSSLLKAGVIPRLRREAPAWLPLRAFRPGADPLLNFAEALARTMADFGKVEAYGLIHDRLFAAWTNAERENKELTVSGRSTLEVALEDEGQKLRAMANRDGATILISIDQAEELARAEDDGAEALADYLQAALASAISPWQIAFTIRTDSFPDLQRHHRFRNLKARGYDLRAVPVFRFESVVEQPAKRYGVQIDEELVAALIVDAPEEDALPLLAFALQRLWRRYAAAGAMSKDNYHSVGGLKQLIGDAAERALRGLAPDQDVPLAAGPPPAQVAALAATAFVPALAQLNEQGVVIRRAAPWSGFSAEQQQLLLSFDRWRLVVRKPAKANDGTMEAVREPRTCDDGTVEIAHEALFREWTRLKNWLEPERARLEAVRTLQLDALTWDRNGRDPALLHHYDKRLAEATALSGIESYRRRLGAVELAYLAACKLPTIGYLGAATLSVTSQWVAAFTERLRQLGWIDGRTVAIEYRWADGRTDRYTSIAAEFVQLKVNVIVTSGTPAVIAAKNATSVIPIVFPSAGDPVGSTLVASLAQPGGNITGLLNQGPDLAWKQVELLREVVQNFRQLVILANVSNQSSASVIHDLQEAARAIGLKVATLDIKRGGDIAPALGALKGHEAALYVASDPTVNTHRVQINTLALAARLPTIYAQRDYVEAGALMSYGPSYPHLWERAAEYVDKILRGANPADIPVEQPTKFELVINLTTANALGLTISPSLLAKADEVIE